MKFSNFPPIIIFSNLNNSISNFNNRDFCALFLIFCLCSSGAKLGWAISPDYLNCGNSTKPDGTGINCCPPIRPAETTHFVPEATGTTRVRSPAHSAPDNGAKFARAIELMKQLPSSDPRSFVQQAKAHCAYCNGGYNQKAYPNVQFLIHENWLFLPFHRWYLYFFERICAKLLQDETFALPFWNWDSPSGMQIPRAMLNFPNSSLFDQLRNAAHLPPALVDLNWNFVDTGTPPDVQIKNNLVIMHKIMVTNATSAALFMGQPFRAGEEMAFGPGSIENGPHNALHSWVGDPNQPNLENMGSFYSAARDPIFYPHHANTDRLWSIWMSKFGGHVFGDADWLESSFLFYNEDAKPVLVKVKDCLDMTRLGYEYEDVEIPWVDHKSSPRRKGARVPSSALGQDILSKPLDKALDIVVKRPNRSRSEEKTEEVLVIEGIEYDCTKQVKFDVFINEDNVESCSVQNTEFLGSFRNMPRGQPPGAVKSSFRFPISGVLEQLGGGGSDNHVLVTLVPRYGVVSSVGGVKIEFDAS